MYARQPKKMLAINILNILQKYTDAEHVLSQKEIKELLETEFDMTVERKAAVKVRLSIQIGITSMTLKKAN